MICYIPEILQQEFRWCLQHRPMKSYDRENEHLRIMDAFDASRRKKKGNFLISLISERCWLTPSAASSVEVKSTPFRSSFLEVLGGMTGISPSDPNVPAAWSRTSSAYNVQRTEGDINRTTTGADSRVGRASNFFYAFVSFFGNGWGHLFVKTFNT